MDHPRSRGIAHSEPQPLLERVAERLERSARILEAHGRRRQAGRAQRYASRIRLTIEEPERISDMRRLADSVLCSSHHELALGRALDGGTSLLGGDLGNIQLRDPVTSTLRIAVQSGFNRDFMEYFAVVDDDSTACGRAAAHAAQTVIADVWQDPAFAPHRSIAAAAGFRAVVSTPLVDPSGRVRGVLSVHFRRSHRPTSRDLEIIGWYGDIIAAGISAQQLSPTRLYEVTAAQHRHTADRHEAVAALMRKRADALLASRDESGARQMSYWARRFESRARSAEERGRDCRALAERPRAGV